VKLHTLIVLAACLPGIAAHSQIQPGFEPGNLSVLRVGNTKSALASSGGPVFLDEYTTNGVLTNSVAIPTNGPNALIISGTASSEGAISRSPDKQLIVMAGYNTDFPYTSSLANATAAAVPRGIGTVDYNGSFTFITNTRVFFSENNIRSGTTDGANNFWAAGATSGTIYLGLASPQAILQTNFENSEVINLFNGNLCFSEQKVTPYGVYAFAGAPVTANTSAALLIATGGGSSPFGFVISPDNKTAYVADDRSRANGGGIQKFTNNGAWTLLYTLGTGAASTVGARGIVASFGQPPILYATTAESSTNRLIAISDTNSDSVARVLATAGANEVFHGVQFAPQGNPPSITNPLQDQTIDAGQPALLSVTASGSGTLYFLWESNAVALTAWKTNSTLTLATAGDPAGAFSVEVLVSNSWGMTNSQATLTINPSNTPPAVPTISSEPRSLTVNAGGTAAFSVMAAGPSLSYQWQENGANLTNGPNVTGAASAALTLSSVFGANAGSYAVVVSNASGAITSTPPALLTVVDPFLAAQPVGGFTFLTGQTATLSVTAIGTDLNYQWTFNGAAIPGQTNSLLALSNLVTGQAGSYAVVVSNIFGVVTSAAATVTIAAPQTAFIPSNLVILRVGDGEQALANSGNTLFLDQLTPNGAYVSTMSLPDSGASALLISGVATTEGFMTRSADGRFLAIAGYHANRGVLTSSLSSSTSAAVPRAIGAVDATGAYALAISSKTLYSEANLRSGATDGGGNFWGAGSTNGICYFGATAPAAAIENSIPNCRVINIVNGALVFSTQFDTNDGLFSLGTLPTSATAANLVFLTAHPSAPEDFAFNTAGTLAYVADDSTNGAGGLQRWQLEAGGWTNLYTLGTGAPGIGARSLAVNFNSPTPLIYAVTAETAANRLILITDAGPASPAATLAVAPQAELFRAVKFAPMLISVPPPALSAIALSGSQFSFTVAGVPGYSYAIEVSPDLVNWAAVQTNTAPFTFTLTNAFSASQRFFRAVFFP
jgi:hypothetical protein